ncbi:MAG: hypothetical protein ABW039_01440 [Sphingobium sp.]
MQADRRLSFRLSLGAAVVSAVALTACQPARQPPPAPPPPVVPTVMPLPPMGSAPDMDLPEADETGKYMTPNRNMTGQQALWHLRMGLNVAALGCRTPGEPAKVQYNRMLHIHVLPLRLANDATENYYKARYNADAFMMREKINTIVYNYFALPPAQKAFCEKAVAILTIVNGLTPQALVDYAPKALAELEQPFQDFWEAYADYLRRLEEWRRRYGRPSVIVTGGPSDDPPQPVAPAAPTLPFGTMPDAPPERPSNMVPPAR